MNNKKRLLRIFLIGIILSITIPNLIFAQLIIKGKVTDINTKKPIAGADIQLLKWDKGALTEANGRYEIKLPLEEISENDLILVRVSGKNYNLTQEHIYYKDNPTIINFALKKKENQDSNERITEIYKIRYRDPEEIFQIITPFLNTSKWVKTTVSSKLKTITVKDTKIIHYKIAKVIRQYDVPLKKVWLEVMILRASQNGNEKQKYPKNIDKIVKKLQSLFKFEKYQVAGSVDGLGLEGSPVRFESAATLPFLGQIRVHTTIGYADEVIKLNNLSVSTSSKQGNILATTVNIGNGETIILGASRGDQSQGSLITVITAKVIE